jgi:hypothetical protein
MVHRGSSRNYTDPHLPDFSLKLLKCRQVSFPLQGFAVPVILLKNTQGTVYALKHLGFILRELSMHRDIIGDMIA